MATAPISQPPLFLSHCSQPDGRPALPEKQLRPAARHGHRLHSPHHASQIHSNTLSTLSHAHYPLKPSNPESFPCLPFSSPQISLHIPLSRPIFLCVHGLGVMILAFHSSTMEPASCLGSSPSGRNVLPVSYWGGPGDVFFRVGRGWGCVGARQGARPGGDSTPPPGVFAAFARKVCEDDLPNSFSLVVMVGVVEGRPREVLVATRR
ncbi:uncharacterized protein J3D65DRAFT_370093 [Phyllosticta citribraziliensis]|uniref:Uncharacterized protein n=1 Tax=Phyllosticta citribraziliensis TaxID=989973 RepID=A0ABR1LPT0_9PEZI